MTTEDGKASFDPAKLAAALNEAAEVVNPERLTLEEKLSDPLVWAAIKNMKARRKTSAEIADVLKANGIKTTAGSLNATLQKIKRKAEGEGDAKPKREAKSKKPTTTAAPAEAKTDNPPKQSEAKSGTDSKPTQQNPSTHSALTRKA